MTIASPVIDRDTMASSNGADVSVDHAVTGIVPCAHCGLPVPESLIDASQSRHFCCAGCQTVYDVLHAHGLSRYYVLSERESTPVRPTGRGFEEFDHPTFHERYVRPLQGGACRIELYLEGVHCASCLWLIERAPLLIAGVLHAELDVRRSLARITWTPETTTLSSVARALDQLGYTPHPYRGVDRDAIRRGEDRALLARIGIAGAISVNVMLASLALYSGWLGGMDHEWERYFRWICFIVVTPALLGPGRTFFTGAWASLRARTLHMDVPVALGLTAGYARGAFNTITDRGPVYFDGLATLIFALLVGRYLQLRGQRAASDATELLYALTPMSARVVDDDGTAHELPTDAVLPGMTLDVHAGETFPADGVVVRGQSRADCSLLTGEAHPVAIAEGTTVYAGTVNVSSPVWVRVEHAGEESRVAKIMRRVETSASQRAPIVQLANRVAGWFVAAVITLAIVTALIWLKRNPARAADNAIALLIVTCPCALALSTPLAVSVAIGRAARTGIYVASGEALEALARPAQMLLDKTGTITQAQMALVSWDGDDALRPFILGLEGSSTHPIAAAFRDAWPTIVPAIPDVCEHVAGSGIAGCVQGRTILIGTAAFLANRGVRVTRPILPGYTAVFVAVDGAHVASATIGDPVRPDAAAAVAGLRARGWTIGILSGDTPSAVVAAGTAVGIAAKDCQGDTSPEAKAAVVGEARRRGAVVMVGDGINDAAAIAGATVGVGVHGGAEASLSVADVYLTTPGLTPLVELIDGASRTMAVIRRNMLFSAIYNTAGALLAMSGVLTPLIAAILMPVSSLTVVLASWRARTFRA